jgi:hypothetical protein
MLLPIQYLDWALRLGVAQGLLPCRSAEVYLPYGHVFSWLTTMSVAPESVLLFNILPTPHLLFSPAFVIEAVSDSYLRATLMRRESLVGQ